MINIFTFLTYSYLDFNNDCFIKGVVCLPFLSHANLLVGKAYDGMRRK